MAAGCRELVGLVLVAADWGRIGGVYTAGDFSATGHPQGTVNVGWELMKSTSINITEDCIFNGRRGRCVHVCVCVHTDTYTR